jgi:SAM-dependent methyltransferase
MPGSKWSLERLRGESNYWRARILIAAGRLGVFARIGRREKTAAALASRLGGSPAGWEIFLDALCAQGLLRKRRMKYSNTSFASRYLAGDEAAFFLPEDDAWEDWGGLSRVLRTGRRPKVQRPFASDGGEAGRLLHSLDRDARKIAPFLIAKLALSRSQTLLDVGGGLGAYSVAFCRRYPRLRGTLVEHPRIASLARRAIRKARMARRVRVVAADFSRQPLPRGFDAVWLSNVLHSRGVDENRALIGEIYRSLNPGGRLIVRDVFMRRDKTAPEWAALFSVLLLLQTPRGRCWALDEIVGWLDEAGFSRIGKPFPSSPLSFDPNRIIVAQKGKLNIYK